MFNILKMCSHLVLGTLVLSPPNTRLTISDLNLDIMKVLC
jgi:hypothetical protein